MAKIVFGPTIVAYGWIILGYVVAGLVLYAVFVFAAYRLGLFQRISDWPWIAKFALASGLLLMGVGCFVSVLPSTYSMLIPAAVYVILTIFGGLALRAKNSEV